MEALDSTNMMALALYVAAGLAMVFYLLRIFLPMVRRLLRIGPDPRERAAELLERYYQEKRENDPRHRDYSVDSGTVR